MRCVEGSRFRISASADSAGIQAIDIVIWLYKRFSDGKPLDYHSEYFSTKKPPTAEELKKAKVFLEIEKEYVQERIG